MTRVAETGFSQTPIGQSSPPRSPTKGMEFQATQSMELPLDDACTRVASDAKSRQGELREIALRGSPRQKVEFLSREVFVPTPDFVYVTDTAKQFMRHARLVENPGGMRIRGGGGSGKDAIIRYLIKQHPSHQSEMIRICPLLSVTFGSHLAPTEILGELLMQLGSAYRTYQSIRSLEEILHDALEACQTKGIIFNEAQHLLKVGRAVKRNEARLSGRGGDWLKGFLDKTPLPVFFFGISGWDEVFELDGQLRTRIPNRSELSVPDDKTFLGILQALDEAIPLPEPAGLVSSELAEAILKITNANWRLLIMLLRAALFSAATSGAKKIGRQDLSYAYALNFGDKNNPFGPSRRL